MSKKALVVNAVVVFALVFAAIFYIDGYVLYPIAGPKIGIQGSLSSEFYQDFDIHSQGSEYENATVIDRYAMSSEQDAYLLEQGGELHVVQYEIHPFTARRRIQADVLVTEPTCNVTVDYLFFNGIFEITDGRITNLYVAQSMSKIYLYRALYLFIPLLITAPGTFLLSRSMRRKQAAYAEA